MRFTGVPHAVFVLSGTRKGAKRPIKKPACETHAGRKRLLFLLEQVQLGRVQQLDVHAADWLFVVVIFGLSGRARGMLRLLA